MIFATFVVSYSGIVTVVCTNIGISFLKFHN